MKVKDVMAKSVKRLSPEMNLKEALEVFLSMDIGGLPVLDQNDKLLGIFTEKDVLKSIFPAYLSNVGKFVYKEDPKWIKNKLADLANIKVKDAMLKEIIAVDEETGLAEAAHIMITQKIRRLPVLDKQGRVVGIVARQDVIKGLMNA